MSRSTSLSALWAQHGRRLLKYAAVSCVGVVLGTSLLYFFHSILGWGGVVSNISAVCISTVPSYLLNRAWVWEKTGDHKLGGEVLPFWLMAALGLVLSTIAVAWAEANYDNKLIAIVANLSAFGVLWVAKYFILDNYLFGNASKATATHSSDKVAAGPQ